MFGKICRGLVIFAEVSLFIIALSVIALAFVDDELRASAFGVKIVDTKYVYADKCAASVEFQEVPGLLNYCSGTVVEVDGQKFVVAPASKMFYTDVPEVSIRTIGTEKVKGKVLAFDLLSDSALIALTEERPDICAVKLSESPVTKGDFLINARPSVVLQRTIVDRVYVKEIVVDPETNVTTLRFSPPDDLETFVSGTPLLNERGELVATVANADEPFFQTAVLWNASLFKERFNRE